jgi:predicted enzyme related to lactoylglutathione lyase
MTFYIDVDDLAVYRKRIVAEGGKIHVEEQEVPGMGSFTLFTDSRELGGVSSSTEARLSAK